MDPISIITMLSAVAPTLIKWATGSDTASTVAQIALDTAKGITGSENLDDSVAALKQNPELALQFQTAMLNRESEFEKLYMDDKANARNRDIALAATPRGNIRANYLVGFALAIISVILFIIIMQTPSDEYVKSTISLLLGMFLNELKNIYSFEFGSTRVRQQEVDSKLNELGK